MMATFPDLTPYVYGLGDVCWLNVGWLGSGLEFHTGTTDERLIATLARLAVDEKNVTRGWHDCEFCDKESPIRVRIDEEGRPYETEDVMPRWDLALGHGEVHIPSDGARVYVAPTLILHYIMTHRYLPPEEFLEALARLADAEGTQ